MPRAAKQQYRIYIHGHSFRHVFGTPDAKEVTAWMVKLYKGQQPGFPRVGPYDWSVEKLDQSDGNWYAIDALSKQALIAAIHKGVTNA
jgi:hypothetical protein